MSERHEKERGEVLNHLGTILMRMKSVEEADERIRESVDIVTSIGRMRTVCLTVCNRANVLLQRDNRRRRWSSARGRSL